MKNILLISFLAFAPCLLIAQKDYHPYFDTVQLDFSEKTQKDWLRWEELAYRKDLSPKEEKEWEALKDLKGESMESIWDVMGAGCSWYCGGGPDSIFASSQLNANKTISYDAANAHDLSFKTAWVEGVSGYGIGESISYIFNNESPRINKIIIHNGYIKSKKAWQDNSRVKTLKVSENGKSFGLFHLSDIREAQYFSIDTKGRRADGLDLILTFEIVEIYPGDKYDDTAITEIYFDGIDVH